GPTPFRRSRRGLPGELCFGTHPMGLSGESSLGGVGAVGGPSRLCPARCRLSDLGFISGTCSPPLRQRSMANSRGTLAQVGRRLSRLRSAFLLGRSGDCVGPRVQEPHALLGGNEDIAHAALAGGTDNAEPFHDFQ